MYIYIYIYIHMYVCTYIKCDEGSGGHLTTPSETYSV